MALIHQEASEDFPEKSVGRAAFNSDLVDITGVAGGAAVGVIGAVGMGVLGLGGAMVGLGLLGVFWGLLGVQGLVTGGMMGLGGIGSTEMLVGSLKGLLGMLGVEARGGESISMSKGLSLPNARENSPFWLLVMAKVRSYTLRGGTKETLDLLLRIAYKGDSVLDYLTWAILTKRPTSVKRSVSQEQRLRSKDVELLLN